MKFVKLIGAVFHLGMTGLFMLGAEMILIHDKAQVYLDELYVVAVLGALAYLVLFWMVRFLFRRWVNASRR